VWPVAAIKARCDTRLDAQGSRVGPRLTARAALLTGPHLVAACGVTWSSTKGRPSPGCPLSDRYPTSGYSLRSCPRVSAGPCAMVPAPRVRVLVDATHDRVRLRVLPPRNGLHPDGHPPPHSPALPDVRCEPAECCDGETVEAAPARTSESSPRPWRQGRDGCPSPLRPATREA